MASGREGVCRNELLSLSLDANTNKNTNTDTHRNTNIKMNTNTGVAGRGLFKNEVLSFSFEAECHTYAPKVRSMHKWSFTSVFISMSCSTSVTSAQWNSTLVIRYMPIDRLDKGT